MFTFFPPLPIQTYEIDYSYTDPLNIKCKLIIFIILIIIGILKLIYDNHKKRKK